MSATAATIVLDATPMASDAQPRDTDPTADGIGNGVTDDAGKRMVVGTFSTITDRRAGVFVFKLPTLSPGQSVTNTVFEANYFQKKGTPSYNVDLWYVRTHATSSTVLASDYAAGPSLASGQTGQQLMTNFVTGATGQETTRTYSDSTGTLAGLLMSNYYQTQSGGGYVFIRIQGNVVDTGGTGNVRYEFDSADAIAASTDNGHAPRLKLTVIPEPAGLGVLSVAALLALPRRRPA